MQNIVATWQDPEQKTLMRYTFPSFWTWEEFWDHFDEIKQITENIPYRIDVIADVTACTSIPANAIMQLKNISERQSRNIAIVAIATPSRLYQSLYKSAIRIYPNLAQKYVICNTVTEAVKIIQSDRASKDAPSS